MRLSASRKVSQTRRGFTLVEVLIVVVIIGIIAAIAVPYYSNASEQTRISALATITRSVQNKIAEQRLRTGTYPASIDPAWFGRAALPEHPQNKFGVPAVEVVSAAGLFQPANKVLNAGAAGSYWYNVAEGVFRARVAESSTSAATLATYNLVNRSAETALGNDTGTGGSSGSSGDSGTGGGSGGDSGGSGDSGSGGSSGGGTTGGSGSGGTGESGGSSGGSGGGTWGLGS